MIDERDAAYGRWEHANAYSVELVVTSLYATDGSVARPARNRW